MQLLQLLCLFGGELVVSWWVDWLLLGCLNQLTFSAYNFWGVSALGG